ncbi:hypothetical protein BLNAU_6930 [Blattamonas nauphoetae]|uniref:RRM domain-containing protein n=1 Tax=Blattamonas nauphoetae TaxID=2049346 RepID=A0ABQ9Y2P1_9EUKA|nr:hypothetical protein BLNAU_6930 [Blattamonas nauphoetae]
MNPQVSTNSNDHLTFEDVYRHSSSTISPTSPISEISPDITTITSDQNIDHHNEPKINKTSNSLNVHSVPLQDDSGNSSDSTEDSELSEEHATDLHPFYPKASITITNLSNTHTFDSLSEIFGTYPKVKIQKRRSNSTNSFDVRILFSDLLWFHCKLEQAESFAHLGKDIFIQRNLDRIPRRKRRKNSTNKNRTRYETRRQKNPPQLTEIHKDKEGSISPMTQSACCLRIEGVKSSVDGHAFRKIFSPNMPRGLRTETESSEDTQTWVATFNSPKKCSQAARCFSSLRTLGENVRVFFQSETVDSSVVVYEHGRERSSTMKNHNPTQISLQNIPNNFTKLDISNKLGKWHSISVRRIQSRGGRMDYVLTFDDPVVCEGPLNGHRGFTDMISSDNLALRPDPECEEGKRKMTSAEKNAERERKKRCEECRECDKSELTSENRTQPLQPAHSHRQPLSAMYFHSILVRGLPVDSGDQLRQDFMSAMPEDVKRRTTNQKPEFLVQFSDVQGLERGKRRARELWGQSKTVTAHIFLSDTMIQQITPISAGSSVNAEQESKERKETQVSLPPSATVDRHVLSVSGETPELMKTINALPSLLLPTIPIELTSLPIASLFSPFAPLCLIRVPSDNQTHQSWRVVFEHDEDAARGRDIVKQAKTLCGHPISVADDWEAQLDRPTREICERDVFRIVRKTELNQSIAIPITHTPQLFITNLPHGRGKGTILKALKVEDHTKFEVHNTILGKVFVSSFSNKTELKAALSRLENVWAIGENVCVGIGVDGVQLSHLEARTTGLLPMVADLGRLAFEQVGEMNKPRAEAIVASEPSKDDSPKPPTVLTITSTTPQPSQHHNLVITRLPTGTQKNRLQTLLGSTPQTRLTELSSSINGRRFVASFPDRASLLHAVEILQQATELGSDVVFSFDRTIAETGQVQPHNGIPTPQHSLPKTDIISSTTQPNNTLRDEHTDSVTSHTPLSSPSVSPSSNISLHQLVLENVPSNIKRIDIINAFQTTKPRECTQANFLKRVQWIATFETVEKRNEAAKNLMKVWALHPAIEVGFRVDKNTSIPIPRPPSQPTTHDSLSAMYRHSILVRGLPVGSGVQLRQDFMSAMPEDVKRRTTNQKPEFLVQFSDVQGLERGKRRARELWGQSKTVTAHVFLSDTIIQQIAPISAGSSVNAEHVSKKGESVQHYSPPKSKLVTPTTQPAVTPPSTAQPTPTPKKEKKTPADTTPIQQITPLSVTPSSNFSYRRLEVNHVPEKRTRRDIIFALSPHPCQCSSVSIDEDVQWIATFESVEECNSAAKNLTKVWALHPTIEVGFRLHNNTSVPIPRPSQPGPSHTRPSSSTTRQPITQPKQSTSSSRLTSAISSRLPPSYTRHTQSKPRRGPASAKKSTMTLMNIPKAIEGTTLLGCFYPFMPHLEQSSQTRLLWTDWTASFANEEEREAAKSVAVNVLDFGRIVSVKCGSIVLEKKTDRSNWFEIVIERVPLEMTGIEIRAGLKGVGELDTTLIHILPINPNQPPQMSTASWSIWFQKKEDVERVLLGKCEIIMYRQTFKVKKCTDLHSTPPTNTIVIVNFPNLSRLNRF